MGKSQFDLWPILCWVPVVCCQEDNGDKRWYCADGVYQDDHTLHQIRGPPTDGKSETLCPAGMSYATGCEGMPHETCFSSGCQYAKDHKAMIQDYSAEDYG